MADCVDAVVAPVKSSVGNHPVDHRLADPGGSQLAAGDASALHPGDRGDALVPGAANREKISHSEHPDQVSAIVPLYAGKCLRSRSEARVCEEVLVRLVMALEHPMPTARPPFHSPIFRNHATNRPQTRIALVTKT